MKKIIIILFFLMVSGSNYSMEQICSRIKKIKFPTISLRNIQQLIVIGGAAEMFIGSYEANDEMVYGGILMGGVGMTLIYFDTCMQTRDRRRLRVHFPEPRSNDSLV